MKYKQMALEYKAELDRLKGIQPEVRSHNSDLIRKVIAIAKLGAQMGIPVTIEIPLKDIVVD